MQIFSTFEHSAYLELAISALQKVGVKKERILAVPLNSRVEERRLFDTLHRADGVSLFDKGAAIATALSVVGASIGFVLEWGPIYWGLIGAGVGFIIGFTIDYIIYKVIHRRNRKVRGKKSEVVIVVDCPKELVEKVEEVMWEHLALGVAKVEGE
ncbi:membrane protein [Evansella cellulosilytica]|uniref:membrane protein n=1 Tax=Evansella cellulosilytica TaxID=1413 RepID=UPI0001C27A1D|nr:membrane protein [Evansella cellulosilytica]